MIHFLFQNFNMETWEILFSNPGLSFIAIDIFKELNLNSLINARLVCKSWNTLIDATPYLPGPIQKKKKLLETITLESVNQWTEKWPSMNKILSDFLNHGSNEDILKLGSVLQNCLNILGTTYDPLELIGRNYLGSLKK